MRRIKSRRSKRRNRRNRERELSFKFSKKSSWKYRNEHACSTIHVEKKDKNEGEIERQRGRRSYNVQLLLPPSIVVTVVVAGGLLPSGETATMIQV